MEKCGVFARMTAEQKLAAAQEKRLCLFCFKHLTSQECFAKTDAAYKGCGVNGCKEHHNADLHFLMTHKSLEMSFLAPPSFGDFC